MIEITAAKIGRSMKKRENRIGLLGAVGGRRPAAAGWVSDARLRRGGRGWRRSRPGFGETFMPGPHPLLSPR